MTNRRRKQPRSSVERAGDPNLREWRTALWKPAPDRARSLAADAAPMFRNASEAGAGILALDGYRGCDCGCSHCSLCGGEIGIRPARIDESALEAALDALTALESGRVLIGAAAEPYPALETRQGATRALLRKLARRCGFLVSLFTRSPLVLRDADLFRELAARHRFQLHFCLPSCSESLLQTLEPGAPTARTRLATLERLAAARVAAGVRIAPVAPGLNDSLSDLEALVRQAAERGAHFVSWDVLALTESNRERFLDYLSENHPHLLQRHSRIFAQRSKPSTEYQRLVGTRLNALKRKYGFRGDRKAISGALAGEPIQLAMPTAS